MKLIKKILIPILLIIIFTIGIIIYSKNLNNKGPEICINKACFNIEIAKTDTERQKGLMFHEQMPEKSGMIFVFEQAKPYGFWMKNTLIPLDMIWINDKLEIVDIQQAEPCKQDPCPSYNPKGAALYVLELNKGISDKYGIKIGDKTIFRNILAN